jgi:hypothetical protein
MSTRSTITPTVARRARIFCLVVTVGSLVGGLLALVLMETFRTTYEDGLEIAAETAIVAGELADPVSGIVADVQELTRVAQDGLVDVVALVENAAVTADEVGTAAQTNLADSLDGLAQMTRRIADFVERVERFIPGQSDSLAEDLDLVAAGLEPAGDQLRGLGDSLVEGGASLEATAAALADTAVVLEGVERDLEATAASITGLPALAADLEERATELQDQLWLQLWLLRLLIVAVGGVTAAGAYAAAQVLGDIARRGGEPDVALDPAV